MKETPPPITPLNLNEADIDMAEEMAKRLGFEQTAYTSTSGLWGLFCLNENPHGLEGPAKFKTPYVQGCIIKTKEFGLLFVAGLDDLQMHDLADRERKALT